jgi:hypothetical protein
MDVELRKENERDIMHKNNARHWIQKGKEDMHGNSINSELKGRSKRNIMDRNNIKHRELRGKSKTHHHK